MLKAAEWLSAPADFLSVICKGDDEKIADTPAVLNQEKCGVIFRLELSDQDRRQLIDGNPIYLAFVGGLIPFAASANLAEVTELIRSQ